MYARFRNLLEAAGGGRSAPGKSIPWYKSIGTTAPLGPATTADVEAAGSPSEAKAIVADAVGMAEPLLGCAGADPVLDRSPELLPPLAAKELEKGAGASCDPVIVDPSERIEV